MTVAPKKLAPAEIETLLCGQVEEGWTIVCHFVPSRVFRVLVNADGRSFKLQQLSRAHGDKWMPLSLHAGIMTWAAWGEAWNAGNEAQKQFLLELRKQKIQHTRAVEHGGVI